jgi:GTP pyrophosphokinase
MNARELAAALLADAVTFAEQPELDHADRVAASLAGIDADPVLRDAVYATHAAAYLQKPREALPKRFAADVAQLALQAWALQQTERQASAATGAGATGPPEIETVRKMLLAFSKDVRVVWLRLASTLEHLRWLAAHPHPAAQPMAQRVLQVYAPLANRLGAWQLKWELEDLAFRLLEPEVYHATARKLDQKRTEREAYIAARCEQVQQGLQALGLRAQVTGRPKHIYSIVKKMRGKNLDFDAVHDIRALRVVVPERDDCYAALAWVHQQFQALPSEFDDYIAKPKANGYQSLHTVVRDAQGRSLEIQIRSQAMHAHAELGVAAHWAYKEAGAQGYGGVKAVSAYDHKLATLRQLLAWGNDLTQAGKGLFDDHIYVLTPQAQVVELPLGATALDFAYRLHTDLGHRCRGAKIDGAMVPLTTPLQNGQTVEVVSAKEGGPSRDWLLAEGRYLVTARARAKVRAWFNAQAAAEHVARGRELVDKLLQREGKTSLKLDDLAQRLGLADAAQLFELVGKDELSLRAIEAQWRPMVVPEAEPARLMRSPASAPASAPASGDVLVVGVDSLLTQLARCCRPAPPDAIRGFVTRGRGISIHRSDCRELLALARQHGQRLIDVTWGERAGRADAVYQVDVLVHASDRQGLLRDVSDALARLKINVVGLHTASVKDTAHMTFTLQLASAKALPQVLASLQAVPGVSRVGRR